MAQNIIKYIAYFDTQDSDVKRNFVTSASNKLEYIAKSIASLGKKVEIISMSQVQEQEFRLYKAEKKQIAKGVSLKLFLSWGCTNGILKKIRILWQLLTMFFYLLLHCGKKDVIIVYHSLGYFDIIRWAKKLKRFKLILEVEEIYSDVSQMSPYWRNLEFKMFGIADAFIFSNDFLDAKINVKNKQSTVIYGTYQVEPKRVEKFNDGKIHVVYAGTFDSNKGGAQTAILATEFLPENYHIHICGFGTPRDIDNVKILIKDYQQKSKATITYDGFKKGLDFIDFLQSCHIGLSTQKPEGDYNNTSFPSKILTYMANGLAVVSIRIPVLEKTAITDAIAFYDEPLGPSLAMAIQQVLLVDNRKLVNKLNDKFIDNIKLILDNKNEIIQYRHCGCNDFL